MSTETHSSSSSPGVYLDFLTGGGYGRSAGGERVTDQTDLAHVTYGQDLSAFQMLHDKPPYKFTFTLLYFLKQSSTRQHA